MRDITKKRQHRRETQKVINEEKILNNDDGCKNLKNLEQWQSVVCTYL